MIKKYFKSDDTKDLKKGGVLQDAEGIYHVNCPCNLRTCRLGAGHKVSVSEGGAVSTGASIGWKATTTKPQNWCHWQIKDGVPVFYGDAKCPGAQ